MESLAFSLMLYEQRDFEDKIFDLRDQLTYYSREKLKQLLT